MAHRIPASVTSAYNQAVNAQGDAAAEAVRAELQMFFRENPGATVEEAREYAIQLLQGVGDLHGQAASQAAYDLLQNVAMVEDVPMPDLGSWYYEPDAEAIDRTAHYHAGKLKEGDVDGFIDQIADAAREVAKRGANETMSQAARSQDASNRRSRRRGARTYGVYFARVPMGPTTCDFCLMLASRGFVYLSEESAGEFDRFHRHCDCKIIPGTPGTKVDGYDPDEFYDRWKHPEKYADEKQGSDTQEQSEVEPQQQKPMTERQKLEAKAREAYIRNGGGMGLTPEQAAERFDLLVDGNTDAQLRQYIKKNGGGSATASDLRIHRAELVASPEYLAKLPKTERRDAWQPKMTVVRKPEEGQPQVDYSRLSGKEKKKLSANEVESHNLLASFGFKPIALPEDRSADASIDLIMTVNGVTHYWELKDPEKGDRGQKKLTTEGVSKWQRMSDGKPQKAIDANLLDSPRIVIDNRFNEGQTDSAALRRLANDMEYYKDAGFDEAILILKDGTVVHFER